jgi:hypothetical protein
MDAAKKLTKGKRNETHWIIVFADNRLSGGEFCSRTVDGATGY